MNDLRKRGWLLKDKLLDKGIIQKNFAREIGITEQHLSRIISGKQQGSLEIWQTVCEKLNISMNDFFD